MCNKQEMQLVTADQRQELETCWAMYLSGTMPTSNWLGAKYRVFNARSHSLTKPVIVLGSAEADLEFAATWYGLYPDRQADLAQRVEEAIDQIAERPRAYPSIEGEFRRVYVRRFPYSLIYRGLSNEVVIVSIWYSSNHPDFPPDRDG